MTFASGFMCGLAVGKRVYWHADLSARGLLIRAISSRGSENKMYRPQFPFPDPPAPCEDQTCLYSFDSTNLPVFTGSLAAGQQTGRIPLRLDKDADFYLRAFDTQGGISIRLEDTDGNALSDSENPKQQQNFVLPKEYGQTAGAGFVALESGADGVFGPGGGNYVVYLFNATGSTINLTTCAINLVGVKRYSSEGCN